MRVVLVVGLHRITRPSTFISKRTKHVDKNTNETLIYINQSDNGQGRKGDTILIISFVFFHEGYLRTKLITKIGAQKIE